MLQLRPDQFAQVESLRRHRLAQGIAAGVKSAWPALVEHLGERCTAFIDAAVERGHQAGLRESGELARYTCLCGLWGVGFEARPGFEWAADIIDDTRRTPALKLHQLLAGSRQALAAATHASANPSVLSTSAFDATLALLASAMDANSDARAIFLDATRARPPLACDIGAATLALRDATPLSRYVPGNTGWQREASPQIALAPATYDCAPEAPPAFDLMGSGAGCEAQARAALNVQTHAACDERKHPEVLHVDAGRRDAGQPATWTGPHAARLVLALEAPQPLPDDPAAGPAAGPTGIGHVLPPREHTLSIASCGVRDAGAPFGAWATMLKVHESTQWLCEVRHGAAPAIDLPANALAMGTEANAPTTSGAVAPCRLEADGLVRDASAWDRQWKSLLPQCSAGVEKLFNAWARGMADGSAQLEGELSPLVGGAGLSWGWQRADAERIASRVVGRFDWTALAADLRFGGIISMDGARARLQLQAQTRIDWRSRFDTAESADAPSDMAATLATAKCEWRQPFTLSLDPIVGQEPAMLYVLPQPEPWRGALVGLCGLRPRPDEKGWQWFFTLRTEAVQAEFVCADALLGERRTKRELLPALTLVEWSAG